MKAKMEIIRDLARTTATKIIMLVIDGLGGIPDPQTGKTELETAFTPNLDDLAAAASCGLTQPVGAGITPGSAPGHLALFGYDPIEYQIGRGVLEALGVDFQVEEGDVVSRGNFCKVDRTGAIIDRRAGRLTTEKNKELCLLLDGIEINGIEILVRPVKDHRCIVVLRGPNLVPDVSDTDPQVVGTFPLKATPLDSRAAVAADVTNQFLDKARSILNGQPANMLLLRGFSALPDFPSMFDVYKLKTAAIAGYPMYRGLAKVVGMDVLKTGLTVESEIDTLVQNYAAFDFFFLHVKGADSAGEDGDFKRKVDIIQQVDALIPQLTTLSPDVLVIAGDHSTPALMNGHSWHSVPCLIHSVNSRYCGSIKFGETDCLRGSLGTFPAVDLMATVMAEAGKLAKFGA